ncbi:MAG TPA: winged helix-turn-helix domain-containing tetratricopeptide repeat protein, partial [Rhizomicrobium sp.]|nr:winged helix-turn-helix domain-containing tetratricopeptide repeat protein [Rhizomicrobium sp.]
MRFSFADHTLDTDRRELRRGPEPIAVEPQVFDLLIYLINNRDRVVSKDDLIASIWGGRIVSDSTLTSRINAARTAIGDSGQDQKLIRTFARKGLRFIGDVRANGEALSSSMAESVLEQSRAGLPLPERPAIAVLPFANMSGDPEQEYFSDGISEDIITALSKLRWFFVIARNSSFTYKGKSVHMKQVAEELGVRYVVEGSVRKVGDRVRITAQLNDVETGSHIWAERYDRNLADVFAVQDEITEAIVAAIEPQLYAAENFRAQRKPPDSMDAWDLVMRALSHYGRVTRQDNVVAQALLEKAIAIDPQYGQALGLLATSYTFSAHMGWVDMAEVAAAAGRAAISSILADSEDPWAHFALGGVYMFARRFDDSLAEFELALRLNPNFALAQGYYGLMLTYCGRWEEGIVEAQRALRLSPRDPCSAIYCGINSYAHFAGGRYEDAIRIAREGIRQRVDFVGAYRVLASAAGMAGHTDIAKDALCELLRVQ